MNETIQGLFEDLLILKDYKSFQLEQLAETDARYLKDLKLNVSTVLKKNKHLGLKEAYLLGLAAAVNQRSEILIHAFEALAKQQEASAEELSEVHACVSLMNANNVFYRFRHYLAENDYYNNTPAGLRMNIMMDPVLGKELFELMSLAVSALNGCERCVVSHEASVKQQGGTEGKIYEAVRLVSVIKSLAVLI